jgi:hypothetical protein
MEYEWRMLAGMQKMVGRTCVHKGQLIISSQLKVQERM